MKTIGERAAEQRAAARKIEGYAAIYYDGTPETEYKLAADIVERIAPGAFDDVLASGPDVRALFNHNPDAILGRTTAATLQLKSDRIGLHYTIELPDAGGAADLLEAIRRGDVAGASFGFRVGVDQWEDNGWILTRTIQQVSELFDVGPATFPAYVGTSARLRTATPATAPTLANRERLLRLAEMELIA